MTPVNINARVRVRLTPHGRAQHAADHAIWVMQNRDTVPACLLVYTPPREDAEGWSDWRMWALMEEFGPHTGIGKHACFDCDILIGHP